MLSTVPLSLCFPSRAPLLLLLFSLSLPRQSWCIPNCALHDVSSLLWRHAVFPSRGSVHARPSLSEFLSRLHMYLKARRSTLVFVSFLILGSSPSCVTVPLYYTVRTFGTTEPRLAHTVASKNTIKQRPSKVKYSYIFRSGFDIMCCCPLIFRQIIQLPSAYTPPCRGPPSNEARQQETKQASKQASDQAIHSSIDLTIN